MDGYRLATGTDRPRNYWSDLKTELLKEGSELSDKIGQMKLPGTYLWFMVKTPRKTGSSKPSAEVSESQVSEPQATYSTKAAKRMKPSAKGRKGYDARRYTGMIPGIAERMKEYLKHMRDDR
jgi:hypothetical protein